jgi:hypothetical protein
MVMDHTWDKWQKYVPPQPLPYRPVEIEPYTPQPLPFTDTEIEDLRDLLRRAREYDKDTDQPDCELEEKKQRLLKLAEELGVKDKVEKILEQP